MDTRRSFLMIQSVKIAGRILAALGMVVALVGLLMPYVREPSEYSRRYALLGPGQSAEFHALRADYETSAKYCEDYGVTVALLGGLTSVASYWRRLVRKLPTSYLSIAMLGAGAAITTVLIFVARLFLEAFRGEFPWWADSLGIPLAGMPFIFAGLVAWSLLSSLLKFWSVSHSGRAIRLMRTATVLICSSVVVVPLTLLVAEGDFLAVPALLLWAAFFGAILRSGGPVAEDCVAAPDLAKSERS